MADDYEVVEEQSVPVKVYTKPAITHELQLETRAGTPLIKDPIIDPLGIDPSQP